MTPDESAREQDGPTRAQLLWITDVAKAGKVVQAPIFYSPETYMSPDLIVCLKRGWIKVTKTYELGSAGKRFISMAEHENKLHDAKDSELAQARRDVATWKDMGDKEHALAVLFATERDRLAEALREICALAWTDGASQTSLKFLQALKIARFAVQPLLTPAPPAKERMVCIVCGYTVGHRHSCPHYGASPAKETT